MRSRYFLYLCLFSILVTSNACEQKNKENVIAQINDLEVTELHFTNAFKEFYHRTGRTITPSKSTRLSVLNSQFENYVLATYAEDLGIGETEKAFQKKGEIERRVLNEEYLNSVLLKDIQVTENDLNSYFLRFNSTLKASHLFTHDLESAESLYKRIKNGESFEELAKEVFQTPYLANNGGDVGRFSTDVMDIAFEEAAFALKVGEISKPVPTAQGYSIIKLTDRFTKPILTRNEFANKKAEIASYVIRKKRELAIRSHMYEFQEELNISQEVFDELWDKMNQNYQSAIRKDIEFINSDFFNSDITLASKDDFSFSLKDFATELRFTPIAQINSIEGKDGFENFVVGLALRGHLYEQAIKEGLDKNPLYKESIEETYYIYLASEAVESLKGRIINTENELRAAFRENPDRFYKPLEVSLSRLVVESEEKAKALYSELKSGTSFESLVHKHTILNEDLMTDGRLGLESIRVYGSDAPKIALLEKGDISEIFNPQTGMYIIYKMNDKVEGRAFEFEEAKDYVEAFLTNQKLRTLKQETIEAVKKKHNAFIDIEKLNEITIQI